VATSDCYAAMGLVQVVVCKITREAPSRVPCQCLLPRPEWVPARLARTSRDQPPSDLPRTSTSRHQSAIFHYLASWAHALPPASKSDHHVLLRVSLIKDRASGSRLALREPRAQTFQDTYLTVRHQEQCWCNCRSRASSDGVAIEWTITSGRCAHLQEASGLPFGRL
jgi:hypothetical protein